MKFNRRDFLWSSASLAAVAASERLLLAQTPAVNPTPAPAARGAAADRLNVAVIGIHGRGRDHLDGMAGRHNCVVTHVCDVDTATQNVPAVAAKLTAIAARQGGVRPEFVQDLRRIMDNPNIQLVTIATPNHWHSLAAIWALAAGKHVYVEKPVSHNIWEGRRLVEASRHYNKLCQAGTQIRSSAGSRQAIEYLRSGALGRVEVALCPLLQAAVRASADARGRSADSGLGRLQHSGAAPAHYAGRSIACISHYDLAPGSGITATATWATRASTRWTSPVGVSAQSGLCSG